jgi:hypothetical protein
MPSLSFSKRHLIFYPEKTKPEMKNKFLNRDPSGFVFKRDDKIYRVIKKSYQKNYNYLLQSGLYDKLCSERLLIPHTELKDWKSILEDDFQPDYYKVIEPQKVDFISYPYEWCFDQLKDAAVATLLVQKEALDHNMSLKDASAYNIQFIDSKPIFIDTLSFEIYEEGNPWIAYKQFCQHFLAPLALMSYKDLRLHKLLANYSDGIPLDLVNLLLPFRSKLNAKILLHITLHSKAQKKFSNKKKEIANLKFSRASFNRLIDSLLNAVRSLKLKDSKSIWINYYEENILNSDYLDHKVRLITALLHKEKPLRLWDVGSNTGRFSEIASEQHIKVVSFDSDPLTVNKFYNRCKAKGDKNILPLIMDLINPSGSSGWALEEHSSLIERANSDIVLALAIIHHLAITNNIPLNSLAEFFASLSKKLIIEFVPKHDPNAQLLLRSREDVFINYNQSNFEKEFGKYFKIFYKEKISASDRVLYLMERI